MHGDDTRIGPILPHVAIDQDQRNGVRVRSTSGERKTKTLTNVRSERGPGSDAFMCVGLGVEPARSQRNAGLRRNQAHSMPARKIIFQGELFHPRGIGWRRVCENRERGSDSSRTPGSRPFSRLHRTSFPLRSPARNDLRLDMTAGEPSPLQGIGCRKLAARHCSRRQ
jgi:hypothetical protein